VRGAGGAIGGVMRASVCWGRAGSMKLHRFAGLVALAVIVVAPHAPAAAADHRSGGPRGHFGGAGDGGHFRGGGRGGHFAGGGHGAPHGRHFFGHHSRSFIFVAPSPFFAYDYTPPVVYAPPVVYTPPVVYPPPAYVSPPAYAPPATPTVVQYPTGRYELRGDGMTTPYVWVWVPNPPPGPPPAPPAPPAAEPAPAPAPTRATPPAAPSPVYRWTDERGVTTWTDNPEKIPVRYRPQARALLP
jgi:hypothetical protein